MKHNYTNELELKSLIIRIQTARKAKGTFGSSKTITDDSEKSVSENRKINKYIEWFIAIQKMPGTAKTKKVSEHLRNIVIAKSEVTPVDHKNYEKFGEIIMEMVRHILTKQQFRGYTYYDDFMSDSVYKILKYLDNFDHKIVSRRTGEPVKAFAYVSQIIQNSIIFVITRNKKEQDFIKSVIDKFKNDGDLLESWETEKEKISHKEVHITSRNIIQRMNEIIENEKLYLKNINNFLTFVCDDIDNLDIDELSAIESIKRGCKNVKFCSSEQALKAESQNTENTED